MDKNFVVRVGSAYIGTGKNPKAFYTRSLKDARRFDFDEAQEAAMAMRPLTDKDVYVAHENRPDDEYCADDPPVFVVTVGRMYVKNVIAGKISTSYRIDDAARFPVLRAERISRLLKLTWPDLQIQYAHESMPFVAVSVEPDPNGSRFDDDDE